MVRKKATVKQTGKKTAKRAAAKTSTKKGRVAKTSAKKTIKKSVVRTGKKAVRKALVKSSPVQEYEQTIAKTRTGLGKAHVKAVTQCQKPVDKLQAQLSRMLVKQKAQQDKKVAATQRAAENGSQGAKSQAARARAALRVVNEKIKEIRAELKTAKLDLASAKSAQKKFAVSEKMLEKFERDWIKASAPKRKVRRRTRKVATTETNEEISASTVEETGVLTAESETPTQASSEEAQSS